MQILQFSYETFQKILLRPEGSAPPDPLKADPQKCSPNRNHVGAAEYSYFSVKNLNFLCFSGASPSKQPYTPSNELLVAVLWGRPTRQFWEQIKGQ